MRTRKLHHTYDTENDNQIEELELEIGTFLDEYDVEYPTEEEIMLTIHAIRPHVPVKENKWNTAIQGMASIIKQAYEEMFYVSPLFWTANGLLFLIALTGVFVMDGNPYTMMMILAPIPTITGLIEVLKSRNSGMAELEMSFKYSFQELILSKMLVVGGFNLVINLLVTISFGILNQEILVSKLLLYWMTPFTVITALSLLFVSRYRGIFSITGGVVLWLTSSVFLSQTTVVERIESMPAEIYLLVIAAAALTVLFQAIHIYKRGVSFETNH